MTIDEVIAHLRELEAKATPGPWVGGYDKDEDAMRVWASEWMGEEVLAREGSPRYPVTSMENFELVAAMRNALPALLDELDRLRKRLETEMSVEAMRCPECDGKWGK